MICQVPFHHDEGSVRRSLLIVNRELGNSGEPGSHRRVFRLTTERGTPARFSLLHWQNALVPNRGGIYFPHCKRAEAPRSANNLGTHPVAWRRRKAA